MGSHKSVSRGDAHPPGEVSDYVDFAEGAAPSTPASGFVRLYAKTNGSIASKDDAGSETEHGSGGGGGDTVKGWVKYLRERLGSESSHTDDDFYTSDTSGSYTTQTVSGSATWTLDANHNIVSVKFDDQVAADASAYLKSLTSVSAPITIETALRIWPNGAIVSGDFAMAGLVFTDGTATSSNSIVAEVGISGSTGNMQLYIREGTLTSLNATSSTSISDDVIHRETILLIYLRLVWINTTTVAMAFSLDGVTWSDLATADTTVTSFTPTHAGFYVTTWGGDDECYAAFEYLRRYDSDLSV